MIPTQTVADGGPDFDAFAERYDRFTDLWDLIDPTFTTWLTQQLSTAGGERAVDLGCGAGRHSVLLADRYPGVLAVDRSDAMLALARARRPRANIDYQHRDAISVTPRRDGGFDAVVCVHTAHHLGRPEAVLPQIRSLVAPGGIAVVADIINPGEWGNAVYHEKRAFAYAQTAYNCTGDRGHAINTLDLMLHPRWLDMATRDIPLTREQFHYHYSRAFPGAVIVDELHPNMSAAVWRNPAAEYRP